MPIGPAANDATNAQPKRDEVKPLHHWQDSLRRGTKWGWLDINPALDPVERRIVLMYLRRYVTWCARKGRLRQMEGAAALYREVAAAPPQRLIGSNTAT